MIKGILKINNNLLEIYTGRLKNKVIVKMLFENLQGVFWENKVVVKKI